ncbi:MAG TPA: transposase [Verrucomicrobiae bacterium]|jgi:REP element-mobilizing transposase RayT
MEAKRLQQLVKARQEWTDPLTPAEKKQGFKGWYASRSLPHFDSPGTRQFITYRLADAMPAARRAEWETFLKLENDLEKQRKIEVYLDKGYGKCHLRNPEIADLVQNNLWHHDGAKYQLLGWVIMPNHVHVLVEIWNVPLGDIVKSWKSYTSKGAQRILRGKDSCPFQTFWENDYFDRYLRDDDHYRRIIRYIENNPNKAALAKAPADWPWSSARYRGEPGTVVPILTHPKDSL